LSSRGRGGGGRAAVGVELAFDCVDEFEMQFEEPSHESGDEPQVLGSVRERVRAGFDFVEARE
jgi:hypothetical protein